MPGRPDKFLHPSTGNVVVPVSYCINQDLTPGTVSIAPFGPSYNLGHFAAPSSIVVFYEITGAVVDVTTPDESTKGCTTPPPSNMLSPSGSGYENYPNGNWGGNGAVKGGSKGLADAMGPTTSQRGTQYGGIARQMSGANYVLLDGHVKYFQPTQVSTGTGACFSTDLQNACYRSEAQGLDKIPGNGFAVTFSGQ